MYKSFIYLAKFNLKYFILFEANENEIILLIHFSENSLLVYRDTD